MGTFLITGATGGIGAAVAQLLRARGHELILAGRSTDKLAVLARAIRPAAAGSASTAGADHADRTASMGSSAPAVRTLALDLSEPRRIAAALAKADLPEARMDTGGAAAVAPLDGLVHSAGVADLGSVGETSVDRWIEQLMVNLAGVAELTRLLLPALRAAEGQVVFVNSGAGLRALPGWSAYAASKHGLRALADALRAEEPRLRVASFYPGRTATEMQRRVRAQEGDAYQPEEYIDPRTAAAVVVQTLETPRDAMITDVTLRPSYTPPPAAT